MWSGAPSREPHPPQVPGIPGPRPHPSFKGLWILKPAPLLCSWDQKGKGTGREKEREREAERRERGGRSLGLDEVRFEQEAETAKKLERQESEGEGGYRKRQMAGKRKRGEGPCCEEAGLEQGGVLPERGPRSGEGS